MERLDAVVVHVWAAHRCGLRDDRAEDQQQAEMPHCECVGRVGRVEGVGRPEQGFRSYSFYSFPKV